MLPCFCSAIMSLKVVQYFLKALLLYSCKTWLVFISPADYETQQKWSTLTWCAQVDRSTIIYYVLVQINLLFKQAFDIHILTIVDLRFQHFSAQKNNQLVFQWTVHKHWRSSGIDQTRTKQLYSKNICREVPFWPYWYNFYLHFPIISLEASDNRCFVHNFI